MADARSRAARRTLSAAMLASALAGAPAPAAVAVESGAPIELRRIAGGIEIDGDLAEPAWGEATPVATWYETNPGDNVEPAVRSLARLAYDGEYLYAAFEFDDPEPRAIRAPLGDRDDVDSSTDYGGVILDARNDAESAQMFLANAAGIQYDALTSDASGEDSAPDFFWESAGRITERGWQLELRIPFASIRYHGANPSQWGILLYRNRPRDFRYQYFTSRLPRDRNCFICNVRPLVGLRDLPAGGHWVVAPYGTASQVERAVAGPGSALERDAAEGDGGVDLKWVPNPDTVFDATVNPDFSQIESDQAQITTNERFALFQPERRPFFLESIDLFSTPLQAVYTRTFTSPEWGARATGGSERVKYTLLVGEDRGGGLVVLPGANRSSLARQDFSSLVAIGRVRRELGRSFASFLYSGREIEGGGFNRVLGPDFRWRPNETDTLTGQLLWSFSEAPRRPDLAPEWDGRELAGHAAELWWNRDDGRWDYFLQGLDVADEFRADNGFIPQVGYRAGTGELGRTFRWEQGALRRLRLFTYSSYLEDRAGRLLLQELVPGFGLDALWNSFVRFELAFDEVRGVERTHRRFQLRPEIEIRPGKVLQRIYLLARFGDEVDFVHDRPGDGGAVESELELRLGDHLRFELGYDRRWLDAERAAGLPGGRLFTAEVERLQAVYTFDARSWLRVIAQWTETERDPRAWATAVPPRERAFAGSAVFAFKLNWQTVVYLGYSEALLRGETGELGAVERQAFLKVSYAFRG